MPTDPSASDRAADDHAERVRAAGLTEAEALSLYHRHGQDVEVTSTDEDGRRVTERAALVAPARMLGLDEDEIERILDYYAAADPDEDAL